MDIGRVPLLPGSAHGFYWVRATPPESASAQPAAAASSAPPRRPNHETIAAPPLAGTASLLPIKVLDNLPRHHSIQMQEGGMSLTNMNARDMKGLGSLHTLRA